MKRITIALFALLALASPVSAQTPDRLASLRDKVLSIEAKTREMADLVVLLQEPAQPKPAAPTFKRGGRKTPLAKVLTAFRTGQATVHHVTLSTPTQVAMVPKRLSMWGNDKYGDCVSAESAAAMAAYSTYIGVPEIFIPEQTLIAWAGAHGFLDGANLLEVIQAMQKDGIKDETGTLRKEGVPSSVDYTSEAVLKNAIAVGPVSIAIDANALPSTAGNKMGWSAFGGSPGQFQNTDHCIAILGYGPTQFLAGALGVPVPTGAPANTYIVFTWNTIGIVDYPWLMSTCEEAWLRTPTIVGLTPPPVPPTPTPTPPTPGTVTITLTADQVQSVLKQAGANPPLPQGSVILSPATVEALMTDLKKAAAGKR